MPESVSLGVTREPSGSSATLKRTARRKRAAQKKLPYNNLAVDQYLIKSPVSGTPASAARGRHVIPEIGTNAAPSSRIPLVPGAQRQVALGAQCLGSDPERNNVPDASGSGVPRPIAPETLPAMTRMGKNGRLLCNICHVPCSSMINLNQHLRGRRHRMHVFLSAVDSLRFVSSFCLDRYTIL